MVLRSWWRNQSLQRKLELLLLGLTLPMLMFMGALAWTSLRMSATFSELTAYRTAVVQLNRLELGIFDAHELYRQGFADTATAAQYPAVRQRVEQATQVLSKLPVLQPELVQLLAQSSVYLSSQIEPAYRSQSGSKTLTPQSKALFTAFRSAKASTIDRAEEGFQRSQQTSRWYMEWLVTLAFAMLGLMVVGFGLLRWALHSNVLRRLLQLQQATSQMASGDYSNRLAVDSRDELGNLAAAYNQMAGALQQNLGALERAKNLADLLANNTKNLQQMESADELAHNSFQGLKKFLGALGVNLTLYQANQLQTFATWDDLSEVQFQQLIEGEAVVSEVPQMLKAVFETGMAQYLQGQQLPHRQSTVSLAIEPIQNPGGDTVLGCLSVIRSDDLGPWKTDEQMLLQQIAAAIGLALDRIQAAEALTVANIDLLRSNRELEQFAYVASHDLQEPLRMVSSYTQLLARRYQGKLDPKADQYIHFAVDGANRMQQLIQDLLAYSRIGTKGKPLEPTQTGRVLDGVLSGLELAIQESGGSVEVQRPLPEVMADATQLSQVFQNLVGNALKYRHPHRTPLVEVGAQKMGDMVRFYVQDNGIGIEAEYHQRIFVIFQRLHSKEEYAGSGIGLAIVKKIVERHGGQIGLDSGPQGTRFWFTWPAAQGGS